MAFQTIIYNTLWIGITISQGILMGIIFFYLKAKPLGQQTILDRICMDTCVIHFLTACSCNSVILTALNVSKGVGEEIAEILTFFIHFAIITNSAQINCLIFLNYLMLVKEAEISEMDENKLHNIARFITMYIAIACMVIDQVSGFGNHYLYMILINNENSIR